MIFKNFNLNIQLLIKQKNLFLIYGENQTLISEIKEKILTGIKNGLNFSILKYQEDFLLQNTSIIDQFLNSDNLFGDGELLVVSMTTDKILNLFNENEIKNSNKKIIFLSDKLTKKSKIRTLAERDSNFACIACYEDTPEQLQNMLAEKLKLSKVEISREMVSSIFELNLLNRQDINDALNKIQLIQNTSRVNKEMLKEIFHSSSKNDNFEIVNNCLLRNKSIINKSLNNVYAYGINFNEILAALKYKTNKLLDILNFSSTFSINELVENYKPAIFWKEKKIIKDQLIEWSKKDLENLLNNIFDIEIKCKKNYEISSIILQNFLIDITTKRCLEKSFLD